MNALDVFTDARPEAEGLDPATRRAIADELFGAGTKESARSAIVAVEPAPVARGRVPWLVVAAAAAVVALIAGLVAVAGGRDVEAPATPPTELPAVPVEPLRLLPDDTSGFEFAGQLVAARPARSAAYVRLARPGGAGGYVDPVWVARGARDALWAAEPDWEGDGTFSEFEFGGRTMEFVDDVDGFRLVQFEVGDGSAVQLSATVPGPVGTYRDELAAIGLGLDLSDGGIRVLAPPDGFEVVANGRLGLAFGPTRTLNVWRDGEQFVGLSVTMTSDQGYPFLDMGESIEPVTIRGRAGWITTSTWRTGEGPWERSTLIWEERPGQWVKLDEMNPVTLDELGAFAASLVEVDAAAYAAVVDEEVAPPAPDGSETDTTAPMMTETSVAVQASSVPMTSTPRPAPAGTVLVANAAQISGLAGQWSARLATAGADVAEPTDVVALGGETSARTWVFARSDAMELAGWVRDEVGVETVNPFDRNSFAIAGDLDSVDVLVVLGLDKLPADAVERRPVVFGDSVVLGAANVLGARGYIVNAQLRRDAITLFLDVLAVIDALDPDIVVVHVGTNGPIRREELESLLAATADVPNVVLVNGRADREWIATNNALLDEVDRDNDNLIVLDWDTLADDCPGDCFAADDLHLSDVGAAYFADVLGDITGY